MNEMLNEIILHSMDTCCVFHYFTCKHQNFLFTTLHFKTLTTQSLCIALCSTSVIVLLLLVLALVIYSAFFVL